MPPGGRWRCGMSGPTMSAASSPLSLSHSDLCFQARKRQAQPLPWQGFGRSLRLQSAAPLSPSPSSACPDRCRSRIPSRHCCCCCRHRRPADVPRGVDAAMRGCWQVLVAVVQLLSCGLVRLGRPKEPELKEPLLRSTSPHVRPR